jgi:hypothetical protein
LRGPGLKARLVKGQGESKMVVTYLISLSAYP